MIFFKIYLFNGCDAIIKYKKKQISNFTENEYLKIEF